MASQTKYNKEGNNKSKYVPLFHCCSSSSLPCLFSLFETVSLCSPGGPWTPQKPCISTSSVLRLQACATPSILTVSLPTIFVSITQKRSILKIESEHTTVASEHPEWSIKTAAQMNQQLCISFRSGISCMYQEGSVWDLRTCAQRAKVLQSPRSARRTKGTGLLLWGGGVLRTGSQEETLDLLFLLLTSSSRRQFRKRQQE